MQRGGGGRGRKGKPRSTLQRRLEALRPEKPQDRFLERSQVRGTCSSSDGPGSYGSDRRESIHEQRNGTIGVKLAGSCRSGVATSVGGFFHGGGGLRGGGGGGASWPGPSDADPGQRGLETLEVFVEGTRSRDRRFLAPRTGLLRALQVGVFCRVCLFVCFVSVFFRLFMVVFYFLNVYLF